MNFLFQRFVIGFIMSIARFWIRFWMNRALQQVQDVWHSMNSVMCSLKAVRMILIKAENGGGLISKDVPLYLTALNWVYAHDEKKFYKDKLFRHRADDTYWEHVIQQILIKEHVIIRTDGLPDCFLKNLFLAEDVGMSIIFKVELQPKDRPARILYAALDYCDPDVDVEAPEFLHELEVSKTQIRNVSRNLI